MTETHDQPSASGDHPAAVTAADALAARRKLLRAHGIDVGDLKPGQLGLAFSGGGIRSAAVSLGVAQALAGKHRLLDFDYMSTVSGGGYFGSFLRGLFLPQAARGSDGRLDPAGSSRADTARALAVMTSPPEATKIPGTTMTNPVRWLRENSRYLAPAGPTDFAVAGTYIFRNWLAMLFVFALPTLLFFVALHSALHALADRGYALAGHGSWMPAGPQFRLSILLLVPAVMLMLSIVVGVANWMTVYTAEWNPPKQGRGLASPDARIVATAAVTLLFACALLLVIRYSWNGRDLDWPSHTGRAWSRSIPGFVSGDVPAAALVTLVALLAVGAMLSALVAMAATWLIARREPRIGNALFGNEVRRWLTATNAKVNNVLIAMLVLAAIDTIALWFEQTGAGKGGLLAIATALAPLGRWLVQKLQASFGKLTPAGVIGGIIGRTLGHVALGAAVFLWGGFAVLLDIMVRVIAYDPCDWRQNCALSLAVLAVQIVMIGRATGFINLSSLHSLYAARLTRAFIGASNLERLERGLLDIRGYQTRDVILADIYQQQACAAPLHLINVTLNETISAIGSQLLERDRKGIPMVVGPEGIWIDAAEAAQSAPTLPVPPTCCWDAFAASQAEPFSVGQLAAISGAAVSSAMGANTTLGGSLLFTYANIRLGYWWNRGTIGNDIKERRPRDRLGWTGTFGYLLREMAGAYRSTTARVNLSDGGYFENTGVYELLRRAVPTIVVCDNGEDPGYLFEDLENLVRKARLDVGVSVDVGDPREVAAAVGVAAAGTFLNGRDGDWRARARAPDPADPAFALLLVVRDTAGGRVGTIVLLKPSLFGTLPADVWGYAEQHPAFPNESTADQFFTEAQWESYRKLGFMMMQQLLDVSPFKEDLFRCL